eukprot:437544_1
MSASELIDSILLDIGHDINHYIPNVNNVCTKSVHNLVIHKIELNDSTLNKTTNQTASSFKPRREKKHDVLQKHLQMYLPHISYTNRDDEKYNDICILSPYAGQFTNEQTVDKSSKILKVDGSAKIILDVIKNHPKNNVFPKISIVLIELSKNNLFDDHVKYFQENIQYFRHLKLSVYIFHCKVETFFNKNQNNTSIFDNLWQNKLQLTHKSCFMFWDPYGFKTTNVDNFKTIFNSMNIKLDILLLLFSQPQAMQKRTTSKHITKQFIKGWKLLFGSNWYFSDLQFQNRGFGYFLIYLTTDKHNRTCSLSIMRAQCNRSSSNNYLNNIYSEFKQNQQRNKQLDIQNVASEIWQTFGEKQTVQLTMIKMFVEKALKQPWYPHYIKVLKDSDCRRIRIWSNKNKESECELKSVKDKNLKWYGTSLQNVSIEFLNFPSTSDTQQNNNYNIVNSDDNKVQQKIKKVADGNVYIGPDKKGRKLYRGARGGVFYVNSRGNKSYVKR